MVIKFEKNGIIFVLLPKNVPHTKMFLITNPNLVLRKWEIGMESVAVESDSLLVVNDINCDLAEDFYFGLIISDCISPVKEILNCSFSFVRKLANQLAHTLPELLFLFLVLEFGIQSPPEFIVDVLNVDLNGYPLLVF